MNLAKYECEGQISLFDMPQFQEEKKPDRSWICDSCFYDKGGCCGYNTKDDYCVLGNKFRPKAKICEYSKHTCNKEELWKIAEEDDPFCPHVCCRNCNTKLCGVRCNGSEEPKMQQCTKREECEAYPVGCGGTIEPCRFGGPYKFEMPKKINDYEWHSIETPPEEGQFCQFEYTWSRYRKDDSKGRCEGWWQNGKVQWLNMPVDIGHKEVVSWRRKPEGLKPMFDNVLCEHSSKHLCNRWHDGDEYIAECKSDLPKGFACSGCCWNCSQAPQHGGKCRFECRKSIEEMNNG